MPLQVNKMGACTSTPDMATPDMTTKVQVLEAVNAKLKKRVQELCAEIKERDLELEDLLNDHESVMSSLRATLN